MDATARPGEDGSTPLETFYAYSGHKLLEMKKMVVEVNMKKMKTIEEAQDEVREKLVMAIKRGLHFVILVIELHSPTL